MGLLRRPPEPGLPFLDAQAVDASGEAYAQGTVPDGTLGLVSYGLPFVLVGRGDRHGARERTVDPLALAPKGALRRPGRRVSDAGCLLASATSVAMVRAAALEAAEAVRRLVRPPD